jgi:prepilin-type N-terminal cleavage/methylation domain-containing protein
MNSTLLSPASNRRQAAFTLVELLVVIAIIGVLVALLLPAVQAARESARRTQCLNHLKQMGLAYHNHNDTHGHLPTGGWGWNFVGDPDLGFGEGQPGGWTYNILPFIEQKNAREIGQGQTGPLKQAELERLVTIPIKFYNCPSRRPAKTYPVLVKPTNAPNVTMGAKLDYSVNVGDGTRNQNNGGPPDAASDPASWNGLLFDRSKVRLAEVTDGTSNVFMIGEKFLDAGKYTTGDDLADNENLYVGFDNDNCRSTHSDHFPPRRDYRLQPGEAAKYIFGSAHPAAFNVVLCDGSVRTIAYNIDKDNYRRYGNRMDGEPLTWQ